MSKRDNPMRATLAVTLVVFLSKAFGFAREMIMASYFGTEAMMDAYKAAYSILYIPVLLFTSCITSTMVPMYTQALGAGSMKRASRFASNVLNVFTVFSLWIAAAMYLLARPLIHLVYNGFGGDKLALTVHLVRVMLPALPFIVVSIVLSSVLNARGKFVAAQLTGFPLSLSLIVAAMLFSGEVGVEAQAWGVVVAGLLQVAVLLPFMHGMMRYSSTFNLRDERFKKLLLLSGPAMFSMAINELSHMVDNMFASGLPDGSVSALSYSFTLITFLMGVLMVPLTTVVFSRMSGMAVRGDRKGIAAAVMQCTELLAMVALPIIAICIVLSPDIIRLAYQRGKFDEESVRVTAGAFGFFVAGLLAYGYRDLFNRAFHAIQNTAAPLAISAVGIVLNVVGDAALVGPFGANGLAAATASSATIAAGVLFWMLRRRLGPMGGASTLEQLVRIAIAVVLCALVCVLLDRLMPPAAQLAAMGAFARLGGRLAAAAALFIRLAICAGGALIAYVPAVALLRVRQADALREIFSRPRRAS
ncbi:MAG: murein biosynthesis integral membrane protein MurJ [Clostridiales bacterium]|nr:murein biosynthesis integral membrane protein MurJ [Clostridiales bacterium]